MYVTLLFWLALFFPGYAALRRFFPDQLRSGLLGVVAVSYLVTFAILSPVSIAGYALELPLGVLSGSCVIATLLALFEITRRRWWHELTSLLVGAFCFELVLVLADLVLGGLAGGYLSGDARLHLARVRFLVDHGLTNQDPFVATGFFYPIYHTNILHALYASCAQLTGVDHFGVWFAALPWAQLMIVSGAYSLAWCVFQRRWASWAAALFTVGAWGSSTYVLYPNKLAPLWILPCLLAFVVRCCQQNPRWRDVILVSAAALVTAQIHGLYAAIAVLTAAPVIATLALVRVFQRSPFWRRTAMCLVAVGVGLPFVYVSRAGARQRPVERRSSVPRESEVNAGLLTRFDDGALMLNPSTAIGPHSAILLSLLAAGGVGSCFTGRRRFAVIVVGFVAVVSAILFVPPLCASLRAIVREDWIVQRCAAALHLGVLVFVPSLIAYLVPSRGHWAWFRVPLALVIVCGGAMAYGRAGVARVEASQPNALSWPAHLPRATGSADERNVDLARLRDAMAFLAASLPRGAVILTPPGGIGFVALYDCYLVAPDKGSTGVMDMPQRRADVWRMRSWSTPWPERRALLKQYGVSYVVAPSPTTPLLRWARRHAVDYSKGSMGFVVVKLDVDGP